MDDKQFSMKDIADAMIRDMESAQVDYVEGVETALSLKHAMKQIHRLERENEQLRAELSRIKSGMGDKEQS